MAERAPRIVSLGVEAPEPEAMASEMIWADGALSIDDAAAFLGGVHRSYLYELAASGRIKCAKLGRRRVIARRSLVVLLGEAASTSRRGNRA